MSMFFFFILDMEGLNGIVNVATTNIWFTNFEVAKKTLKNENQSSSVR